MLYDDESTSQEYSRRQLEAGLPFGRGDGSDPTALPESSSPHRPFPWIECGVGALALAAIVRTSKKEKTMPSKGEKTTEREVMFLTAMGHIHEPSKLRALADKFDEYGCTAWTDVPGLLIEPMNPAEMLRRRAALKEQPEEVKAARRTAFRQGMSSTNKAGVLKLALMFEETGALRSATKLREHAAGLPEKQIDAPMPSPAASHAGDYGAERGDSPRRTTDLTEIGDASEGRYAHMLEGNETSDQVSTHPFAAGQAYAGETYFEGASRRHSRHGKRRRPHRPQQPQQQQQQGGDSGGGGSQSGGGGGDGGGDQPSPPPSQSQDDASDDGGDFGGSSRGDGDFGAGRPIAPPSLSRDLHARAVGKAPRTSAGHLREEIPRLIGSHSGRLLSPAPRVGPHSPLPPAVGPRPSPPNLPGFTPIGFRPAPPPPPFESSARRFGRLGDPRERGDLGTHYGRRRFADDMFPHLTSAGGGDYSGSAVPAAPIQQSPLQLPSDPGSYTGTSGSADGSPVDDSSSLPDMVKSVTSSVTSLLPDSGAATADDAGNADDGGGGDGGGDSPDDGSELSSSEDASVGGDVRHVDPMTGKPLGRGHGERGDYAIGGKPGVRTGMMRG